jgi:hypothetical protein
MGWLGSVLSTVSWELGMDELMIDRRNYGSGGLKCFPLPLGSWQERGGVCMYVALSVFNSSFLSSATAKVFIIKRTRSPSGLFTVHTMRIAKYLDPHRGEFRIYPSKSQHTHPDLDRLMQLCVVRFARWVEERGDAGWVENSRSGSCPVAPRSTASTSAQVGADFASIVC